MSDRVFGFCENKCKKEVPSMKKFEEKTTPVDNLESNSPDLPLSANMGRKLKLMQEAKTESIGDKITLTRMGNMRYLYIDNIDASVVHSTKIPIGDIPKSVVFGQMQYWDVSTYSLGLISIDTDGNMGAIAKNSSYNTTLGGVRGSIIWFV